MKRNITYNFDNRDPEQMYTYLESRIEALKRRIVELELENEQLRWEICDTGQDLLIEIASA